ncbi:MAG: hypothetical protein N2C14_32175 [Planctomycetales bacterium]
MTKFIGGPYDGMDLPFDPKFLQQVNLPETEEQLEAFLNSPDGTSSSNWPYRYDVDRDADPVVYRFREPYETESKK